jgi:hypothetical protein
MFCRRLLCHLAFVPAATRVLLTGCAGFLLI